MGGGCSTKQRPDQVVALEPGDTGVTPTGKSGKMASLSTEADDSEAQTVGELRQQPRAFRGMSMMSQAAIADLSRSGAQLADIEAKVEEIRFQLDCRAISLPQAKVDLAQLETKAKQLETTGVDAVYTSDLNSGKAEAKIEKKEQLARLESLFDKFEELFKRLKKEEVGN